MAQKTAKASLKRMVQGASQAMSKKSTKSRKVLPPEAAKKLLQQIKKHGRTIQRLPLDLIDLGDNIRHFYDDAALQQLATSLKNDGLIQFPTLGLKKSGAHYHLVCRNGHRRILAAKSLGWREIECMILPFDTAREELYHSLNANIREQVFYLDLALAYQRAADFGESDAKIAERVGVHPRTVGWYRRLTELSPVAQAIIRQNPQLFTATWAIKLARLGPLPPARELEKWLKLMVQSGKVFLRPAQELGQKPLQDKAAGAVLGAQFKGREGRQKARSHWQFLMELRQAGYVPEKALKRIGDEVFGRFEFAYDKKQTKAKSKQL